MIFKRFKNCTNSGFLINFLINFLNIQYKITREIDEKLIRNLELEVDFLNRFFRLDWTWNWSIGKKEIFIPFFWLDKIIYWRTQIRRNKFFYYYYFKKLIFNQFLKPSRSISHDLSILNFCQFKENSINHWSIKVECTIKLSCNVQTCCSLWKSA